MVGSRRETLVLGGRGFIGSHLVEHLVAEGSNVTIVDSCARPAEGWTAPARTIVVTGDASGYLRNCGKRFDEVYHLASAVGPVSLLRSPGCIAKPMVEDLYALIEYCLRVSARMLYASTSEVYGGAPVSAEDDPCVIRQAVSSPRMEYAVAKLLDEIVVRNTRGLEAAICRPFNVCGPRQGEDGGFVMPRLVRQAVAGEPMTVYGDGSCVRSFTHVSDVVRGFVAAVRHGEPRRVYNIGNAANRITIRELAELIRAEAESQSEIAYVDPKELWGPLFHEAGDKVPDATRAAEELGWTPVIPLSRILREVVAEHRQMLARAAMV